VEVSVFDSAVMIVPCDVFISVVDTMDHANEPQCGIRAAD